MPKKSEKKYKGKYYRKRVQLPDGTYRDVYGKTLDERDEKVEALQKAMEPGEEYVTSTYFYEYAGAWYRRKSPHMSRSWQDTSRRYINDVICPVIGQKNIGEVSSDDIADIMATVAGKSRSYHKKLIMLLNQIFEAALDAEEIRKNPVKNQKAAGKPTAKKVALTKGQENTLLQVVAGHKIETFVRLALFAGLRREECLGLCWDCVELEGDAPHVIVRRACRWENNHRPKIEEMVKTDAAWRTIPIPPQLVDHLKHLRARIPDEEYRGSIPVIHGDGYSPLTYSAFRSQWRIITARSTENGLALGEKVRNHKITIMIDFHVRPHILRHTYVTRLILAKVPVKRVQYLAGHADPEITLQIYTDLMEHAPEDLIGDVLSAFAPESAVDLSPGIPPKGSE